jgi:hypothetical protein
MNWRGYGRKCSQPNSRWILSPKIFLEEPNKTMKNIGPFFGLTCEPETPKVKKES